MTLKASNTVLSLQPRQVGAPPPDILEEDGSPIEPSNSSAAPSILSFSVPANPQSGQEPDIKISEEVLEAILKHWGPPADTGGSFNTSLGKWVRHGEAEPEIPHEQSPEVTIHPEIGVTRKVLDIEIGSSKIKNPG